jgi:C_GCAxxG_C_C family probable redox protein
VGEHVLHELPEVCRRMGAGFSGGLGGTHQELCGALSGGVLVISALYGRSDCQGDDRRAISVSALYRVRFLAKYGETQCQRLRDKVQADGDIGSCAALVERATLLLLELLDDVSDLGLDGA